MKTIATYLPFIISLITGWSIVRILLQRSEPHGFSTQFFLGGGLGLGINASLCFASFILFGQFVPWFAATLNLIIFITTITMTILLNCKKKITFLPPAGERGNTAILLIALLTASLPLWILGHFYLHGGWDAWSVWNFKSRMLFLGGENWQRVFLPELWRSSPHYPLLLPLTNVWGWIFLKDADPIIPVLTSYLYTTLTIGLLTSILLRFTKNWWVLIVAGLFFSLPYYLKNSYSQYCDILLAFHLLATLFCLMSAARNGSRGYAILSGIFIGFVSFTKSEGMLGAVLLAGLGIFFLLTQKQDFIIRKNLILAFLAGLLLGGIPTALFQLLYSPGNQTFINGLTSLDKPSTLLRAQIIGAFYLTQFINANWNGLLFLLVLGIVLAGRNAYRRDIMIFPLFFLTYAGAVTFYYFLNTYFEITWWLSVTADRIIYAMIPSVICWEILSMQEGSLRTDKGSIAARKTTDARS